MLRTSPLARQLLSRQLLSRPLLKAAAALLAGLLLISGLQAPADAAVKRTVAMAVSKTSVYTSAGVKFSGKLTRSPRRTIVKIQRKVGTRWVNVRTTRTTNRAGNYAVWVKMPATGGYYAFRAVAPKNRRLRAAASRARGITVFNRVSVTATPDQETVPAGSEVTFTGTVQPFVPNTLVSLQKLLNGKWTGVATAPIAADGTYSVTKDVGPTTQLRVASPAVRYNAVGYSPAMTVTTTPVIATTLLAQATRTRPYAAKLITVDGSPGTWTASPLPDGLTLNAGTGRITGTPTAVGQSVLDVTFRKTETGEYAPPVTINLVVNEHPLPVITTQALPDGTQVAPYSATLSAQDPLSPQSPPSGTWSVEDLPDGLTLNSNTGQITGAPEVFGTMIPVTLKFTQTSTGLAALPVTLNMAIAEAEAPTITTSTLADGTRTLPYTATLTATGPPNGNAVTGTWGASNLPAGLSLNSTTGVISGTPSAVGIKTVSVTFTQKGIAQTQVTRNFDLEIKEVGAPEITTTSLTQGTVNLAYNGLTPTVTTSGPPAGTWSATGLPSGLSIASGTGVISGTPTVSGSFAIALTFTQTSSGFSDTANLNLVILPAISTSTLPDGTRTLEYSATVHAVGDPAGTWTATNLPAGLSISAAGVISGTPTTVQTKTVTVKFTQTGTGQTQVTRNLDLAINEVPAPEITTTSLTQGTVNLAYNGLTPSVTTTGPAAGTWSATGLPSGLSIASGTGVISGTPTVSGSFAIALTFTQTSSGFSDTANLNLVILPAISTSTLPDGTRTLGYSATVHAVGDPAGTWTATNLPAGLSISAAGVISGTPTTVQTKTVTVKFTQTGTGQTQVTRNLDLAINEAASPVISTTSLPNGTLGSAYSTTLTATGPGNAAGTWSATPLPAGLTLDANTGAITGTPTASGQTSVVINFTQTSTGLAAAQKTIALKIAPVIATTSLPAGTRTSAYSTTLTATGNPVGTWTASPLPAGLALDTATGVISGTPTAVESKNVVITFTQTSTGLTSASKTLTLTINEAASPTISTTSLPSGKQLAAYSGDVDAAGDPAGTWSATGLPAGLSLNTSTGAITGTPTDLADVGDNVVAFTFTQTSTGLSTNKNLTITIAQADPPVITTTSVADGTEGQPYSDTVLVAGDPVGTWSAIGLPAGLSIDESTGDITGTPTGSGDTDFQVTFTQTNTGRSDSATISISIAPA